MALSKEKPEHKEKRSGPDPDDLKQIERKEAECILYAEEHNLPWPCDTMEKAKMWLEHTKKKHGLDVSNLPEFFAQQDRLKIRGGKGFDKVISGMSKLAQEMKERGLK